ncbi:6-phosphogluconolactonase (cycloisomerase 2 family) [Microbacterium sp. SLBN-154]|uniref:lactonase family protein n=1 Tax=Microbacterium sp. SLBN-154 TaxID=2768458 RepID=UPI0011520BD5|nr:6-phosphogluconolactonase (cycloisomerase 2 family) [Microbacterium sp. SLBN-154]
MHALVGSYRSDSSPGGIALVRCRADGWEVVARAETSNVSYLAVFKGMAISVNEDRAGAIETRRIEYSEGRPTGLAYIDRVDTGALPCHIELLALSPGPGKAGNLALVPNYGSGNVTVVLVHDDGLLDLVEEFTMPWGREPMPVRQESSHPHQCRATPWGSVVVSDLGSDCLHELQWQAGRLSLRRSFKLPDGTGPRHMVVDSGRLYVVGELDGRLHMMHFTASEWRWIHSEPVSRDVRGYPWVRPSHLTLSPAGKELTASVRGVSRLVFLRPAARGVEFAEEISLPGAEPRHHVHLDDERLAVALQHDNRIVGVDRRTGIADVLLTIDAPACVVTF